MQERVRYGNGGQPSSAALAALLYIYIYIYSVTLYVDAQRSLLSIMTRALQMQKAEQLLHQRHHIIAMTRHGPSTEMTEENANDVEVKVEAAAPAPAPSASLATAEDALADIGTHIHTHTAAELRAANAEARFFRTRIMLSCSNDNRAGHDRRIGCPTNEKNVAMVSICCFSFYRKVPS